MSNDKLLSILIPLYNGEKHIKQTIESAFNVNWDKKEIIIVDDGSTDNSLKIARSYQSTIIKIISRSNCGAAATRNSAFKHSQGEYIQYLDADDLLHPDKVLRQIKNLDFYGNNCVSVCNWIHFEKETDIGYKLDQEELQIYSPIDLLIEMFSYGKMYQTACWLTPRKLIERAGPWDESLVKNPNDDGEFFCRVLLNCESVIASINKMVYYRKPLNGNVSLDNSLVAASSLLGSYISYENNILKYSNSSKIRDALSKNYIKFIYQFYNIYPDLSKEAHRRIQNLGISNISLGSKTTFGKLEKIIGFKNTLKLRRIIKGY